GSALSADRHAASTCAASIVLEAKTFRPIARGDPSSGRLESCAHSRSGIGALPTCVENPAKLMAKEARAHRHTHLRTISRLVLRCLTPPDLNRPSSASLSCTVQIRGRVLLRRGVQNVSGVAHLSAAR